jgi:hypothetical protein
MPPFKSVPHALIPLANLARRRAGRGQAGPGGGRAGPGRGLFGLGIGGLLVAAVLSFGVVLAGATVLSVLRGGPMTRSHPAVVAQRGARPGPPPDGGSGSAPAAPATTRVRAELPGRLDEILRVREDAFARRDAAVLATIYTVDCACLRSGREAIARLRADHAVWRGRSVSVRVERLSRVNDSLWIALAMLRRSAFRIEGEDGSLISAEPAARQRYRFALARTPTGTWLLGHASLVEELPP